MLDQKQDFVHSFGLCVTSEPSEGGGLVTDKIVLDHVRLSASSPYAVQPKNTPDIDSKTKGESPGDKNKSQDEGFAIHEASIRISADASADADCVDSKPGQSDFVHDISLGSKKNIEGSLDASANPKFNLKIGKIRERLVVYLRDTIAIEIPKIKSERNAVRWLYKPATAPIPGMILPLYSKDIPAHEAVFTSSTSDPPGHVQIDLCLTLGQPRFVKRSPFKSILRTIRHETTRVHVITSLEVKIGREDGVIYFPTEKVEGLRLKVEATLDGLRLRPTKQRTDSGNIIAELTTKSVVSQ